MRVILDVNVYISYLLIPDGERVPNVIVDAAIQGRYVLLMAEEIVGELRRKVRDKPYLSARIPLDALDEFVTGLASVAIIIPPLPPPHPQVGRDPKDDYLFAYAKAAGATFIVSGDDDLLSLVQIEDIQILSPAEFARVIDALTEDVSASDDGSVGSSRRSEMPESSSNSENEEV